MPAFAFSSSRRSRRLRLAAPLAAAAVAVALAQPAGAATPVSHGVRLHPVKTPAVTVHEVRGRAVSTRRVTMYSPPSHISWPSGTATLTVDSSTSTQAGKLPVWLGQRSSGRQEETVTVASQTQTNALGIHGLLLSITPSPASASGSPTAATSVTVSYAAVAQAYGGDWASRLRLVQLPTCALTTPSVATCRVQTPLAGTNNAATSQLSASVAPARRGSAAASGPMVLAATATNTGGAGSYSATSLKPEQTWSGGGSSGAFEDSYPISSPPVPGGLIPSLGLGYDSQAVDGDTSATNNQASPVGDGWALSSSSFIERSFQSCSQNAAGSTKTNDECWSNNNVQTLSLNGQSTQLVYDSAHGWHEQADSGERVTYCTGTSTTGGCLGATVNNTSDNGYWVVTETDGTRYVFGLNELPGFATADTTTNSAWTVPVYSTASGQPCYNATFSKSACANTAWRWNLDYVVDTHGNAMSYWYTPETNYYAADLGTKATSIYDRGGYLTTIKYGQRSNTVYTATPAAQVSFTNTGRCTASSCNPATLTSATSTQWPDVPYDQICASGAACTNTSPSYFSEYEVSAISTKTLVGTSLSPVDSWALAYSFPATNDASSPNASLWLASITHTGQDGGSIALPPTMFTPTMYANRVHSSDGYSLLTRARLTQIESETGSVVSINYTNTQAGITPCATSVPTDESANTQLCYPVYWTPPGASAPREDWFYKYVVDAVSVQDPTADQDTMQTNYSYGDAAWSEDLSPLTPTTPTNMRTWNVWRGFQTVTTTAGSAPDPVTEKIDTYFQGMSGDPTKSGGAPAVTITDSRGDTPVTDNSALAATLYETRTFNGNGGALVSDTINTPWISSPTATQTYTGLPAFNAVLVGTGESRTYTPLAVGGSRESDTTTTFSSSTGLPLTVSKVPDTSDPSESTCTTNTYLANSSTWLLDLTDEVTVVSVPCGTTPTLPANAVSDTRTSYDQAAFGTTPTVGSPTNTQQAVSYSGSTPTFATTSSQTVDEYGRPLTATDADSRTTSTAYTPATAAEPTSVAVTSPVTSLVTTTTYDPARDLATKTTDPAGYVTSQTYDAVGRLTAVWSPGNPQGSATGPNYKYAYAVNQTTPSVATSSTLNSNGSYRSSETIYDSELREVETQTGTVDGGRDVADQTYNSDGWVILASGPYYASGAPSATLVNAQANQVPSATGYTYDGDGRKLAAIAYTFATETWRTSYSYGGNYITTIPPTGGVASTTYTDALGRTSALLQYHAGVPTNPVTDPASDYDKTAYTYSYTATGSTRTTTNSAGDVWTDSYNLLGQLTSTADPDAGTSHSTYDNAGQLLSTTDARGKTISYTYDADGRKIAEYDTSGGASETATDELAAWTYDTVKKGELTSSTAYAGGTSGIAYKTTVLAYNSYNKLQAEQISIPSTTATTSAGGSIAGNYVFSYTDEINGIPATETVGQAGGLAGETISTGYDAYDEPTSLGTATQSYVDGLDYTEYGQPSLYTLGSGDQAVQLGLTYDPQTGGITQASVADSTATTLIDNATYSYDPSGNPTHEVDVANGNTTSPETQCFTYDYLDRLTQAWTATDNCAATPTAGARSTVGGPTPYWESWTYDADGNRKTQTTYDTSGDPANDTTNTYSYPTPGSATDQPNTATSITSSNAAAGTAVLGYDAAGDTTSITNATAPSTNQTLGWSDQGNLASDATSNGTTSYIYDADGNLLLDQTPGLTTLYLPGEEVSLNTNSGATACTRTYSLNGSTIASQTASGTSDSIQYLIPDRQGTDTIAVTAGQTQTVTRRQYDPFGNSIGTTTAFPTGQKGYIGGTTDPSTSLENLGAREYDAALGRFLSADPLLETADPSALNGYDYADNNPITNTDPTGKMCLAGLDDADQPSNCPKSNPGYGKSHGSGSGSGGSGGAGGTGGGDGSGDGSGSGGGSGCFYVLTNACGTAVDTSTNSGSSPSASCSPWRPPCAVPAGLPQNYPVSCIGVYGPFEPGSLCYVAPAAAGPGGSSTSNDSSGSQASPGVDIPTPGNVTDNVSGCIGYFLAACLGPSYGRGGLAFNLGIGVGLGGEISDTATPGGVSNSLGINVGGCIEPLCGGVLGTSPGSGNPGLFGGIGAGAGGFGILNFQIKASTIARGVSNGVHAATNPTSDVNSHPQCNGILSIFPWC